jgi:hypothetical protein
LFGHEDEVSEVSRQSPPANQQSKA